MPRNSSLDSNPAQVPKLTKIANPEINEIEIKSFVEQKSDNEIELQEVKYTGKSKVFYQLHLNYILKFF